MIGGSRQILLLTLPLCITVAACTLYDINKQDASVQVVQTERWGDQGLVELGTVVEHDFDKDRLRKIGAAFASRTATLQYAELRLAPTRACLNESFSQLFMKEHPLLPEIPEGDLAPREMIERQTSLLLRQCPVARIIRVGRGVVLQARLGAGAFWEQVLSGNHPLHVEVSKHHFEILLVSGTYDPSRPGRYVPRDNLEATVYVKGETDLSASEACLLWSTLARLVATQNLHVNVREDYAFVTRAFPALYPFSESALVRHQNRGGVSDSLFIYSSIQGGIFRQLGQGAPSLLSACDSGTELKL